MYLGKKIVVVMPAYNASQTLERCYADIPHDIVDEIILVDDVSMDDTVEIARRLGLKTIIHKQNEGYGGNQKTCYVEALKEGADIIVMLHPDHQYDSRQIPQIIDPIARGEAEMVLGSRMLVDRALQGGMPLYKYIFNKLLTFIENLVFGVKHTEYHTGFRAFSRESLLKAPWMLNSNDFVFDTEIIAQMIALKYRIAEIPTQARYFPEASSVNFKTSMIYGLGTLKVMLRFWLWRKGLVRFRQFSASLKDVISPYYWKMFSSKAN